MDSYKWIVHPFSYKEKGHREVSVVHESNFHGLKSYGWFDDRKILLSQDSIYGNVHDDVISASIVIANNMALSLNKNSPVSQQEIDDAIELRDKRDNHMTELFKPIVDDINKEIIKLLTGELKTPIKESNSTALGRFDLVKECSDV